MIKRISIITFFVYQVKFSNKIVKMLEAGVEVSLFTERYDFVKV